MKEMIFPEIFITGKLPKDWTKEGLIADGLSGWGNCMAGATPTENFGKGMALIAEKVGTAQPEELSKLANEIISK